MSDTPTTGAVPYGRLKIAKAADNLAIRLKYSSYLLGGKTDMAFDCTYFAYMVFNAVYSDYQHMDAEAIADSAWFTATDKPHIGDIIYFPRGPVPWEARHGNQLDYPAHVGIVVNDSHWIGRQTSSLGPVKFNDVWWWPRTHRFLSCTRFDANHVASSVAHHRMQCA